MTDPSTSTASVPAAAVADHSPFDQLDATLRSSGPAAAIDRLIDHLDSSGDYRALLDALLLKARHDLGLPILSVAKLADLPDPARTQYEERYIAAIRLVGSRYLEIGEIPTASAYYRAIAETEPVAAAINAYQPAENDERLGAVIEVALNHGVNPRRGFELILENYGTCPAISAFEQLPPQDETVRTACAERLIRHLHSELTANLRAEITRRGQVVPPEGTTIAGLIAGRPWLFTDEAYHIDISHLASIVRMSLLARDRQAIATAVDLTAYGRCLSPRLVFDGSPPFDKIFDDHGVYLSALIGREPDIAVAHFRRKLGEEIEPARRKAIPCRVQPRSWSSSCSSAASSTKQSTSPPPTWPDSPSLRWPVLLSMSSARGPARPTAWPKSRAKPAISSASPPRASNPRRVPEITAQGFVEPSRSSPPASATSPASASSSAGSS